MRHIGIVACSAEGAALCYRTICTEGAGLFGPLAHPPVSMHTPNFAAYAACLARDDWNGVAALMQDSASKLAQVGVEFLVCPDNTIHRALPMVMRDTKLPWLHIAEVVAEEAKSRGFKRLGLLGTRWLVASEVYPEKLAARGISYIRPSAAEALEMNNIIMDELVAGVQRPDQVTKLARTVARMKGEGADAVVLGCTELPLILNDTNVALPTLDSTRLLARAALRTAAA
jgi:aspartate racemase